MSSLRLKMNENMIIIIVINSNDSTFELLTMITYIDT